MSEPIGAGAPTLDAIAAHLDDLLSVREIPDYPPALNGIQMVHRGPVRKVAAAVDLSTRTIAGAVRERANLLLVHHGMFWGGLQPLRGAHYERVKLLVEHDVAVYAAHLPLDAHPTLGNNVLLAARLGLEPSGGFARYQTVMVGVRGESDVDTDAIVERARALAREHGGEVRVSPRRVGGGTVRRTRRWAICTGAGASSETLREAATSGIDTLIVGEGPHHTAVDAAEQELTVIYAGHYATETLGVRALADHVARRYGIPAVFVEAPTGL